MWKFRDMHALLERMTLESGMEFLQMLGGTGLGRFGARWRLASSARSIWVMDRT
ncbi:MAG: hypothetical protein Q8K96_14340 [Rubrivivax sp.]|nr:hypothetical protein [Rubrivivax sp.]